MNYQQLKTSKALNFPKVTMSKHAFYTYEFHTSKHRNQVQDSTKTITLAKYFGKMKTEMLKG